MTQLLDLSLQVGLLKSPLLRLWPSLDGGSILLGALSFILVGLFQSLDKVSNGGVEGQKLLGEL